MTCYALACRQVRPCPDPESCEHIWHACDGDLHPVGKHWMCPTCGNWWHQDSHGVHHRNPISTLTGV